MNESQLEEARKYLALGESKRAVAARLGVRRLVLSYWLGALARKPSTHNPHRRWHNRYQDAPDHTLLILKRDGDDHETTILLDQEDYQTVAKHHWRQGENYPLTSVNQKPVELYRLLLERPVGYKFLCLNGNRKDLRRSNLSFVPRTRKHARKDSHPEEPKTEVNVAGS